MRKEQFDNLVTTEYDGMVRHISDLWDDAAADILHDFIIYAYETVVYEKLETKTAVFQALRWRAMKLLTRKVAEQEREGKWATAQGQQDASAEEMYEAKELEETLRPWRN